MKILLIGGHGTVGSAIASALIGKHEVVIAGRSKGDVKVDISDSGSIQSLFDALGVVDAIICAAGDAKWDLMDRMSEEDFYIGIKSKLMGQVNLTRIGKQFLSPQGSITLTTGILADDPVLMTSSAAMVNGAINSFVKAAALELNDVRINVVCAGLVEDAVEKYQDYFPGHNAVPMKKVANAYLKSVLGAGTGEVIRVYE